MTRTRKQKEAAQSSWSSWLPALFPSTYTSPLASYHEEFWSWVWTCQPGTEMPPFVAIWARGWAKSTNGEAAVVALAARGYKYALYVCGKQGQADDHVGNIGAKLESREVEAYHPGLAQPQVGKFGNQRAWRRSRLTTAAGFTVDAIGLDAAIRGAKLDDARPDIIIFDDIDEENDSPETIEKKIRAVTSKILPAAAPNVVVMVLQNLVHRHGIVSRLVDGRADFLANRIISGPHPAIAGMETEGSGKAARIVGGTPTWDTFGLEVCQAKIRLFGLRAFMAECQHDIALTGQPRFNHDTLSYLRLADPLPPQFLPPQFRAADGLRVYNLPVPGYPYVQYTDPAEGKGRDYTATAWMDPRTLQIVCVLEDNHREPQKHADLACDIGEWYNRPLTGFERAKGEGIAAVFGARGVRLYYHVDNPLTPQQRQLGLTEKRRLGFPMTAHSKRMLIDRLADRIDSMVTGTPDSRMVEQAKSYIVTESMTTEAEAGGFDDLVYAWAGCVLLSEQPGATSLHDGPAYGAVRGFAPRDSGLVFPGQDRYAQGARGAVRRL